MKNVPLNKAIRTRFAPSPTGYLHVGGLRTALYSYLFAKKNGGKFILRVEDTDSKRYVEGATQAIIEGLKWAGLNYDEGPDIGDSFGPYVQSQRIEIYKKYADELIKKDLAYYCFCGEEILENMRKEQSAKGEISKYDGRCLKLSKDEIDKRLQNNEPYVIRMKMPKNRFIEFDDLVRGKVIYNTNDLDDQVLLKSDGWPTYHLAVVVDDHMMEISHVTRTEEWLPSTPKHLLLYEYLGWEPPKFAHLPLLLNADKTKMSKRKGDVAVGDYISKGYLPEAMINFLAFLGWNPDTEKEIYSIEELIKEFNLEKVHKAGAVFNLEKLNWYNKEYIKAMPVEILSEKTRAYLPEDWREKADKNSAWWEKIISLEKERIVKLEDIKEGIEFFFEKPSYTPEILLWKGESKENTAKHIQNLIEIISDKKLSDFSKEQIKNAIWDYAEKNGRGNVLWPFRVSLTGRERSPEPFMIAEILGKENVVNRLESAQKILES